MIDLDGVASANWRNGYRRDPSVMARLEGYEADIEPR